MSLVTINRWGELIPIEKVNLANYLMKLKQTQSLWNVIEEVIKVFQKTQPKKWDSYIIQIGDTKELASTTSINGKTFRGVSVDSSYTRTRGMTNVHQVDFPIWIMLCLRKLYNEEELSFSGDRGKEFFREFGRRFPIFKIHERI